MAEVLAMIRVIVAGPSVGVTSATPTTSNIDCNQSWPSPDTDSPRSFANNSIGVHDDRSPWIDAKKVTSITIGEVDESQKVVTSAIKRLSTEELENMVQSQLGKVIDGHRYNAWLRKQVDDTDIQLAKYQNRIDALQKHVNDLSVVIHKHTKRSDGTISPPMKLTRNVGLQIRIKQDTKTVYEVNQLPSNRSSGQEWSAPKDASVSSTGKQETPASISASWKDQHYTATSNELCGQVESHQNTSLPAEMHIEQLGNTVADEPPINPSTSISIPIDQVAILLPTKTPPSQTRGPPALIPSASCVTLPSLSVKQAIDLTTDRGIPWIPSGYVPSAAPSVPKSKPENPIGCVLTDRRPSIEKSVQPAGSNPLTGTPTRLEREPMRTVIVSPQSHPIPVSSSPSPFKTHSPAGSSTPNVPATQMSPSNDLYSHPDRKRRLPGAITSLDASTIASIEKYHKLIKKHWYNPKTHHRGRFPSHTCPPVLHENRMVQQPNHLLNSRAMVPSTTAQVPTGTATQIHRKTTHKQTQQQAFEKRVKSIGIYRTWKLPAGPVQNIHYVPNPPLLEPQTQNVPHFQNVSNWISPNSHLGDSIPLQEDHLARKRCRPDVHGTNPQLSAPSRIQPEQRKCGSLALPRLHDEYPTQPQLLKPDRGMRNLPDLIAISHEGGVSRSPTLHALTIRDPSFFTLFKPILKLQRAHQGIQVEWNIPKLPPDQFDQIESYSLYTRKGNQISLTVDTPWLRAAVIPALPLPMRFNVKELIAGYWYQFRIVAVLRYHKGAAMVNDVPWSDSVSINV